MTPPSINHEETKNTKEERNLSSCSSFLRGWFSFLLLFDLRNPLSNLLTDIRRARRVVVRQHDNRVTATRIDFQFGVDSGRAARDAQGALERPFRLSLAEKLVGPQCDGEFQQVFRGRITAARRA